MTVFTLYVGCYIEAHYTTTDLYTVVLLREMLSCKQFYFGY